MAFSIEYIYRIVDRFSGPLTKITKTSNKFVTTMEKAGNKLDSIGSKMSNIGGILGGAAAAASILSVSKEASRMEDAMQDVSRVTTLSGKRLGFFEGQLERLELATGKSAIGLAEIATAGGKLGTSDKDLKSFVQTVMKAAMAFDIADNEAGRSIGSIQAKLGLTTKEVDRLLQRVNYLADNTSADGKSMINIIERTSGSFNLLKIPPETSAGWAAFADQIETSSELAASGLNMMLSRMMKIPGMMPKMLKDPKNAIQDFLKRFVNMPEAKRATVILKTFGEEAGRFVMKAVTRMDQLDKSMKIAGSNKALGSMNREFENIMKRSSTMGRRLLAVFTAIRRAVGKTFLESFDKAFPAMNRFGLWVLAFVKAHPGLVKIAGVIGMILVAITAIAVPVGLLFGVLAAGAPIFAAIAAAIGGISVPIVIVVAAVMAAVTWFGLMWKNSTALRQSFSNLADSISPLIIGLKMIGQVILTAIGGSLAGTGPAMQSWGDLFAGVINMVAGLLKGLMDTIGGISTAVAALVHGDLGNAASAIKNMDVSKMATAAGGKMLDWGKSAMNFVGLGNDAASNKAKQPATPVNVGGRIDVSASGGAVVNQATINLNSGSNMVMAQ